METENEKRARLENDAATKRLRLVMETEEKRKARLVKMVATTQLRLALEAEDERSAKKWNGLDLDLIWIEIGVFKNFKECARSPCDGNHFSSLHKIFTKHQLIIKYPPILLLTTRNLTLLLLNNVVADIRLPLLLLLISW